MNYTACSDYPRETCMYPDIEVERQREQGRTKIFGLCLSANTAAEGLGVERCRGES